MLDLPPRQAAALEAVVSHIERHGYPPTVREVAAYMGISVNGAEGHLAALSHKGAINRVAGIARGITIPQTDVDK